MKRAVGKLQNGGTIPLEVSFSKGLDENTVFYVAIIRDITEKLEAEARLKVVPLVAKCG